ncbi:MAG: hypothetical protein MUE34_01860, partial [Acidimicrobiales bacterium]|nr:hypothetical protein [Acidimicrobiales bacterium]
SVAAALLLEEGYDVVGVTLKLWGGPSAVLAAMGLGAEEARGALRLSLGWSTNDADVERAVELVVGAVTHLRDAG